MRKLIKQFLSFFLIPLTKWYLRKERTYTYKNITVTVLPGVFHPGLFYSTKFLIDYLQEQILEKQTLLELGCGTGLISIVAAKAGAKVTSSDLSLTAIKNVKQNADQNMVSVYSIHSDLFDVIEKKTFDWIIINPPYYSRTPQNESELAWYCGENFEYFQKLFEALPNYVHSASKVIMVLTKGSEVDKIYSVARKSGFEFELIREKKVFFDEKDYLFKIKSTPHFKEKA
ncbi:MAG: methyltransferase [Marivirga sp.]|nr:methyltransferase [Marivirga sp.]